MERKFYEADCVKHPWLAEINLSDDEFRERIDGDMGEGYAARVFGDHLWKLHYSWVYLGIVKYFYQTGELKHYDADYMDAQTEGIVMEIMQARGADWDTVCNVLDCKTKYVFK